MISIFPFLFRSISIRFESGTCMEFWHISNLIYLSVATDILAGFSGRKTFLPHSLIAKSNNFNSRKVKSTRNCTYSKYTYISSSDKQSKRKNVFFFFFLLQMFWSNIHVMRNDLKSERRKQQKKQSSNSNKNNNTHLYSQKLFNLEMQTHYYHF